jgi:hypothetical protein
MRNINRTLLVMAVAAGTMASRPVEAQVGMSIWAGAGAATQDGSVSFGKDTKQLGVQLTLPVLPVALRGDAMLFGSAIDTDALSYNVNAVVQMRLPVVQPYGVVGKGRYAQSVGPKLSGWNYGAGVRLGLGRFGVFGEVRKHDPIKRTVTVVGLTF